MVCGGAPRTPSRGPGRRTDACAAGTGPRCRVSSRAGVNPFSKFRIRLLSFTLDLRFVLLPSTPNRLPKGFRQRKCQRCCPARKIRSLSVVTPCWLSCWRLHYVVQLNKQVGPIGASASDVDRDLSQATSHPTARHSPICRLAARPPASDSPGFRSDRRRCNWPGFHRRA